MSTPVPLAQLCAHRSGLSPHEMLQATLDVLERNLALLSEHDDYWLTQWVTRGQRGQGRMGPRGVQR
jgi:hypothetical protein